MPVVGHQELATLLPNAREMHAVVGRTIRTEIEPLGKRILSQEIRRVMNVQNGTFERRIIMDSSADSGRIGIDWVIDHPGANIQDTGGTIRAKQLGSRLVFFIPGIGWRAPHEVTLPARNYLAPALNRIADRSTKLIEARLARFLGGEG